ncbi:MAG: hypothetical protein IPM79_13580 [Polyangiaceae bacterium]|jgi:hypothetical protein|nr:hypothetical protein [Polyangiaceae bacterium]MBK8938629.1 hypothetical protein [Polyangiaceae bacterium]
MVGSIVARRDPSLDAFIAARRPLHYTLGADAALDRPAHVRAASSVVRFGGELVVVQDDAHFLARIDPTSGSVTDVPLERGDRGARLFDDARGNKSAKLDLEAAVVLSHGAAEVMVVFGSGSSPRRERVVLVRRESGQLAAREVHVPELYAALRADVDFCGSELNVEGAVSLDDDVLLFQRGNGAPRAGAAPVDATARLDARALLAHVAGEAPCPPLRAVQRYDLGQLEGARLSFTDATIIDGRVHYVAAAEASPDATRDGPVAGVALGVIDDAGEARYGLLLERPGELCRSKVEGIVSAPGGGMLGVVDVDDPERPAELVEIQWAR